MTMIKYRACTRYSSDGTKCAGRTPRFDGWCGQCDGFTTAEIDSSAGSPWVKVSGAPVTTPLAPDEAYEIIVRRTARQRFVAAHPGVRDLDAEAQIRTLLEDMLRNGKAYRLLSGAHVLQYRGYQLFLSQDLKAVTRYATRHRERTYAQVVSGTPSRIRDSRRLKQNHQDRVTMQKRLESSGMPVKITLHAVILYARRVLEKKVTRVHSIPDEVLTQLRGHLVRDVVPRWPEVMGEDGTAVINDGTGWSWIVANDNTTDNDPVVLSLYTTQSRNT